MPVNGYTVGRDVSVNIVGSDGVQIIIPPDQVTHFDAKPMKREDWSRPLNVPPKPLYMPDGWRLTIEVDRKDASLDTYMSDLEQAYWAGENMLPGTIMETVTEDDGTTTQYRYDGVMLWVDDPGNYRADTRVTQRIVGAASKRIRVS